MRYGVTFDLKEYCIDNAYVTLTEYLAGNKELVIEATKVTRLAGLEGDAIKGYKPVSMTILIDTPDGNIVTSARQLAGVIQEPGKYKISVLESNRYHKFYVAEKIC